jgi:hypothetical protein
VVPIPGVLLLTWVITYGWIVYQLADPDIAAKLRRL